MTAQEFKVWFEGFCEGVHGKPSMEQWAKIKDKVAEIDNAQSVKWRYDLRPHNIYLAGKDDSEEY